MFSFISRRIAAGLVVLLGATFIVFMTVSYAVDPLQALRTSADPNKAMQMARVASMLDLNVPPVLRYFAWLGRIVSYLWGQGSFGMLINGQTVLSQLASSLPVTVRLVFGSLILAIILGIAVGVATALRQYSAFDYVTTFITFLFYSLPAFWVAVLLKEFGAIQFNTFLASPQVPWPVLALISVGVGAVLVLVVGGRWRVRLLVGGVGFLAVALTLWYVSASDWLRHPGLGIVGIAVTALGVAAAVVAITTGFENRRALGTAVTTAVVGIALYYPLQYLFVYANGWVLIGLAVVAIACGIVIGVAWGGPDRRISARTGAIVAFVVGFFIVVDRIMQTWVTYLPAVGNRPIATIGATTPNLGGSFWFQNMDIFTHLALPTIALVLISFASYTRYTRSSLLEVMNQDYIRTARAKGLNERTVVMRHAFRNALIPLATIIPMDVAAMFGGAIITESVFAWQGMGQMFLTDMHTGDIYGVMGYFLVTAVLAIAANIVADIIYAGLDPRIRVAA